MCASRLMIPGTMFFSRELLPAPKRSMIARLPLSSRRVACLLRRQIRKARHSSPSEGRNAPQSTALRSLAATAGPSDRFWPGVARPAISSSAAAALARNLASNLRAARTRSTRDAEDCRRRLLRLRAGEGVAWPCHPRFHWARRGVLLWLTLPWSARTPEAPGHAPQRETAHV